MRNRFWPVLLANILLLVNLGLRAQTSRPADPARIVTAAYGVIGRVLPRYEKDFHLQYVEAGDGYDTFRVYANGGTVNVSGNSAIALTSGVYYYLRHAVHAQFTWEGEHFDLPKTLPDFGPVGITSPYKYRLYYNVCAFGYTTPFWGWKRWQREVDWMALHGINMPLAMVGQEAVWQRVWRKLGLTQKEISDYFTGPAFLPWNRMGNIDKYAGPLPEGYIMGSEALQKKILDRMRELDMHPVVPGFSGYVPKAIKRIYPHTNIINMKSWAGFPPEYGTYMLSPLSKRFIQIGRMFIKEYRRIYGYTHFYLADAFNEMAVPVTKKGRYRQLADFGKAIYNSIIAGDPNGVWVMQGWLFYSDRNFWDKPSVKAFLSAVPDNRMIIIDLSNEAFHGWKVLDGFFGKEWIYSVIHNFGGHNQLFGNLAFYAKNPVQMLSNPNHGRLVGFGISPEGTEQNEVIYELLTDMGWIHKPVHLDKWIENYCLSRYGGYPKNMSLAWDYLLKSVYSSHYGNALYYYQIRPTLDRYSYGMDSKAFDKAVGLFLSCSGSLKGSELYRDDAIEVAAQYASLAVDSLLNRAVEAQAANNYNVRDRSFAEAFKLLRKIDELLRAHPLFRLKRWVDFARSWGKTQQQKDYYEEDAKLQITIWGGPVLSEYAAKEWSGLIDGYYLMRWEAFADSLEHGTRYDIRNRELKWIDTPISRFDTTKPDHPIEFAKQLVAECKQAVRK